MTDLAGWFAAQLDTAEQTARLAEERRGDHLWVVTGMDNPAGVDYDPAFVLADITAKRGILAEHTQVPATGYLRVNPAATGCELCHVDEGYVEPYGWCQTVRLLAAPHAARPGYDPSWAPEQPAHNTAGDTP